MHVKIFKKSPRIWEGNENDFPVRTMTVFMYDACVSNIPIPACIAVLYIRVWRFWKNNYFWANNTHLAQKWKKSLAKNRHSSSGISRLFK